ncbi:GSO1 [Symbiodinium sp. CCMP2592]|nr:GSO1 [Symbiodinium sp. CCMP2592]
MRAETRSRRNRILVRMYQESADETDPGESVVKGAHASASREIPKTGIRRSHALSDSEAKNAGVCRDQMVGRRRWSGGCECRRRSDHTDLPRGWSCTGDSIVANTVIERVGQDLKDGSECDEMKERTALRLFLRDPRLTVPLQQQHHCDWPGVKCEQLDGGSCRYVVALFSTNPGSELNVLSQLRRLRQLSIVGNVTGTLKSLSNMTALQDLTLESSEVTGDLVALRAATDLRQLILYSPKITGNLANLKKMEKMENLQLQGNVYGDLHHLRDMFKMNVLTLHGTAVQGSLQQLRKLRRLTELLVHSTRVVGSLEQLEDMTNMETLMLYGTEVTGNLEHLKDAKRMRHLVLDGTRVTGNLEDLSGMSKMKNLQLRGSAVEGSLKHLKDMTKMHILTLHGTAVTGSLEQLEDMTNMEQLMLYGTAVTGSLEHLKKAKSMRQLILYSSAVTGSLESLRGMQSMQQLVVSGADVKGSLADLISMRGLHVLCLHGNGITGSPAGVIPSMPVLRYLDLQNTQVHQRIPQGFEQHGQLYFYSIQALAEVRSKVYVINGDDGLVYRNADDLLGLNMGPWEVAGPCCMVELAIAGPTIYGFGMDNRVWKQSLIIMSLDTSWELASGGNVTSGAIHSDVFYAVDTEGKLCKQEVMKMTPTSSWEATGAATSWANIQLKAITFLSEFMFGLGRDGAVYKQLLLRNEESPTSPMLLSQISWSVESMAAAGGNLYVAGGDGIWTLRLASSNGWIEGNKWKQVDTVTLAAIAIPDLQACHRPSGWCVPGQQFRDSEDCDADNVADLVCDGDGRRILHSRDCSDRTYDDGRAPPCKELKGRFLKFMDLEIRKLQPFYAKPSLSTPCSFWNASVTSGGLLCFCENGLSQACFALPRRLERQLFDPQEPPTGAQLWSQDCKCRTSSTDVSSGNEVSHGIPAVEFCSKLFDDAQHQIRRARNAHSKFGNGQLSHEVKQDLNVGLCDQALQDKAKMNIILGASSSVRYVCQDECDKLVLAVARFADLIVQAGRWKWRASNASYSTLCSMLVVERVESHLLACCADTCGWNGQFCRLWEFLTVEEQMHWKAECCAEKTIVSGSERERMCTSMLPPQGRTDFIATDLQPADAGQSTSVGQDRLVWLERGAESRLGHIAWARNGAVVSADFLRQQPLTVEEGILMQYWQYQAVTNQTAAEEIQPSKPRPGKSFLQKLAATLVENRSSQPEQLAFLAGCPQQFRSARLQASERARGWLAFSRAIPSSCRTEALQASSPSSCAAQMQKNLTGVFFESGTGRFKCHSLWDCDGHALNMIKESSERLDKATKDMNPGGESLKYLKLTLSG